MLIISTIFGIILIMRTNILLLFLGGICFIVGIFYTFGPLPLSPMPLGELFSGLTQGFGLPLILIYVNGNQKALFNLTFNHDWTYQLDGSIIGILASFMVSYGLICYIFNVMLANNLSDMDADIKNQRLTLPIVVGKKSAIWLYQFVGYSPFVVVIICVICHFLPITALLTLVSAIKIVPNIKLFARHQSKSETFETAIQNNMLFNSALTISTVLGTLIGF